MPHTPDGLTNGEAKVPSDPSAPLDFLHTIAQQAKDNTLYTGKLLRTWIPYQMLTLTSCQM